MGEGARRRRLKFDGRRPPFAGRRPRDACPGGTGGNPYDEPECSARARDLGGSNRRQLAIVLGVALVALGVDVVAAWLSGSLALIADAAPLVKSGIVSAKGSERPSKHRWAARASCYPGCRWAATLDIPPERKPGTAGRPPSPSSGPLRL
jgi:hypothetical protein